MLFTKNSRAVGEVVGLLRACVQQGGGGRDIMFPKGPLQLLCFDAPSLQIQHGVGYFQEYRE